MPEPLETDPIKIPRTPLWLRLVPAICLVAGVGLGIALMLYYKRPPSLESLREGTPSPLVRREAPASSLESPPNTTPPATLSQSSISDTTGFAVGATAGLPSPSFPPTAVPAPGGEAPGAVPGSPTPPTLQGSLPGGLAGNGTEPVKPIVIEGDRTSSITSKFTEYVATVPDLDIEPLKSQINSLVRAAGGQVQLAFDRDAERPEAGTELYLAIPVDKAEKFRDDLAKLNAVLQVDSWSGPLAERHYRMERFLREAIAKLESRLSLLRVKYLDDAPEVVRNEALRDRIQKALKEFKPVAADREGIRVFVGKSAGGWP